MDLKVAVLCFCMGVLLLANFAVEETSAAPAPKKNEADYHYHKESHKNKHKHRHKHRHGHRKKKYRRSGIATPEALSTSAIASPATPSTADAAAAYSTRRQSLNARIRNALLGGRDDSSSSGEDGPSADQARRQQQQFDNYNQLFVPAAARQSNQNNNNNKDASTSFGAASSLAADFNTPDMQFQREETGGEFAADTQGVETGAGGFERSSDKDEFATGFGNDYQLNFEEYGGPYTASGDIYRYDGYKKK